MSDKFRKVFPIAVTFVEGELPTSAKLNSLGSQTRNGLTLIEKAIGDIWNQSGDENLIPSSNLFQSALYINSLGRSIGQQHLISPRLPTVSAIARYRDLLTGTTGKTEAWLRYRPVPSGGSLIEGDFIVNTDTAGALGVGLFKTNPKDVDSAGDWHVTSYGKLITFTTMGTVDISYDPDVITDVDSVAQANVIPDPNTDDTIVGVTTNFTGLKIAYANDSNNTNGFWVYLPPRKPLVSDRKLADSPNETNNMSAAVNFFFQDLTATASSNAHFRYRFCKEVEDIISSAITAAVDKTIPDNFLNLYDSETGTIIEGLTFEADKNAPSTSIGGTNVSYVVRVKGSKLNTIIAADTSLVTTQANQAASAYKSRFKLIQPGTSVARALGALIKKHADHVHDNTDGSQPLDHSKLKNLYDVNSPSWTPSGLNGDDHIQYLHRDGYNTNRDPLANGLRGGLLLLSTSNTISNGVDSYPVYFGTTSKSLYYDSASDALSVVGGDLRIETSNKRIEFAPDESTVYLDHDRMDKLWKALNLQKAYTVEPSSTIVDTTTTTIATISGISIPTGLQAYLAISVSTNAFNRNTTSQLGASLRIRVNSVSVGEIVSAVIQPNTGTNGSQTVLSNVAISSLLSAGSHTVDVRATSTGTDIQFFNGQLIVTVVPYAT